MCHIQMQSRFFKVNFADLDCTTLSTSSLSYIYSQKLCDYSSLLTAEDIWFKCDLYLQFIPPITLWKICIDLRPFSKCFRVPFSKTLRSNNLEIQKDENSK